MTVAAVGVAAALIGSAPALAGATGPDFREGYIEGDGARLYVMRTGEGPLMLFLHGLPDSWALYEPQLRAFGTDYLVVAPNLRGFPPSDVPDAVGAYATPRLLRDIRAVLDHFGRDRCTLIGNDWGGYVAWVYASAYPTRVERLIILNAPHPAVHLREIRSSPAQIRASQYEWQNHTVPPPYPLWYNYYRADPIKVPASLEDGATMNMPDLARHFFAGLTELPATTSLRVAVPTLVIWGMQDPYTLPGQLDGLGDYVPDLHIVRIEDAGHYPMRSHPDLVTRIMRDFVRRSG
jgi:epoxide hydrolase 4